jgi:hypothetical protein
MVLLNLNGGIRDNHGNHDHDLRWHGKHRNISGKYKENDQQMMDFHGFSTSNRLFII